MKYLKLVGVCLGYLGLAAFSAPGQTWDAKDDYSTTRNPNGAWTYGWSTELAGPLVAFPTYRVLDGANKWEDDSIIQSGCPNICYNPSNSTFIGVLPPHRISMHPGPGNQFTHCRWTALESGTYNIEASFTALDYGGPHGYVLVSGLPLADSLLRLRETKDYSFGRVILKAGDTVESVVGVGADEVFSNDTTGFSLTITKDAGTQPAVFDAKANFSTTQNPSGPWSYGWSTELAGPLTLFPNYLVFQGGDKWQDDSILQSGCPNLVYNPSSTIFTGRIPPLALSMHPGPGNQFTHCRWTAPESGTYNIQGSFTPVDYGGPHGYILKNGTSIGDSLLTEGVEKDYAFNSMVLAAGDTIEAVVGVGADDAFFNDQTDFSLTITKVTTPPPTVYDAKADFSTTRNPSGPWTYGWSSDLAGSMTVFPNYMVHEGGQNWVDYSIMQSRVPAIYYNPLDDAFIGKLPPHHIGIHPGPANQFTHCRWTAPKSGTYSIHASFTAVNSGGPHGYILENGTTVGDSPLPEGVEKDYSFADVPLAAGDTVEVVVGVGANGSYYNDLADFCLTIGETAPINPADLTTEFYGIRIILGPGEGNNQSRPRLYARYGQSESSIAIDNLEVMDGRLPKRALELTLVWAALHRVELLSAWDAIRQGKTPPKIAPLD